MPVFLARISGASAFIPGAKDRSLVLRDINWQIAAGCHTAVLGANGAGKSSLLRLLAGDLRPCRGEVVWKQNGKWDDSAITGREITALVSPHIQAVCQLHGWDVTVEQMLAGAESASPLAYAKTPDENAARRIAAIMEELQALELLVMHLPELSQGQLRLALLARALLARPRLLLLDEWADGLDSAKRQAVASLLLACSSDITMIFASHRASGIPHWIREFMHMRAGRLLPGAPCTQLESAKNPCPSVTRPEQARKGETVLSVANASVYIDRRPVLRGISWTLKKGEHWRISGPNGSGKSTFLRMLAGDELVAAGGRLRLWSQQLGREVETLEEKRRVISLVSDLGQALYGYALTGRELLLSGCDNSIGVYREFTEAEKSRADALLELFFSSAAEMARASIRRVSTGQLRRLFLARALMTAPEILLLDEPCSGLDAESRTAYLELLARVARGEMPLGPTPQIVLVSHYAEDVPDFVRWEARMENGCLMPV